MASGLGREDASCRMRDAQLQLAVMACPPRPRAVVQRCGGGGSPFFPSSTSPSSGEEEEGVVLVTVTTVLARSAAPRARGAPW